MFNLSSQFALSIPTSSVWDPSAIQQADLKPELKEILIRMYQNLNLMANVLNLKDSGIYNNSFQTINSQQWFPNPNNTSSTATNPTLRPVSRKVINFGALPNASTKSVPHGLTITSTYSFTRIYACSTDITDGSYIPIPYASCTAVADNVELNLDNTNVNITTGSNRSNYLITYVIIEFIQF